MRLQFSLLPLFFLPLQAHGQNIARPQDYPFADLKGGRANYQLASAEVNEFRLYDFYQRQADFYMERREEMPEILPAYPGLEGGEFGHWGKFNQNNYSDTRWNETEAGEVVTQLFRLGDEVILKAISLRLGEQYELSAIFDPLTLQYRAFWKEGFLAFQGHRWGCSRGVRHKGDLLFFEKGEQPKTEGKYLGYRRYGRRMVFEYESAGAVIHDEPWAVGERFYRHLSFVDGQGEIRIPKNTFTEGFEVVEKNSTEVTETDLEIVVKATAAEASAILSFGIAGSKGQPELAKAHYRKPLVQTERWPETIVVKGQSDFPKITEKDSPYRVDTIPVPFENPYKSVMQLTGLAFLPSGDALVSTLFGEVWKVTGLDDSLAEVTWSRFATGFNQPIGVHIDEDGIFILDRGQLYRLHDENGDGEVDFYENYANDFGGYTRSHTHTFGLHRTADGAFHFIQREHALRTGPDRITQVTAHGVRNCMGIGGSKDTFLVAPQEGTWTPASAIIEVNSNEFYGLSPEPNVPPKIDAPLCFVPRGIDNSTGGMVEITSDKWGPYKGNHIGISYGYGTHYMILRDGEGSQAQGATVPLPGEFLSGAMRGAFHPQDGQLYLVGLDGWGDYATQDGCFHRVRYTGKPAYKPSGFQVFQNGIRIDFPVALDSSHLQDSQNYFAHAWNYEYAKRYGSPEFSLNNPKSLGHDPVTIRSVLPLADGRSIFVEMPEMPTAMQLHIRMHLKAQDGSDFKTDLFASPLYPSAAFQADGLAPVSEQPLVAGTLRARTAYEEQTNSSGQLIEGARKIVVNTLGGLVYEQTLLEAKPGEALSLTLRNKDVMGHNLVIVQPGATQLVGEASFKMLNDPEAGKKQYVPDVPEVLTFVPVVDPDKEHIHHFRAPEEPGDYPYLCTFPGHWQVMQGVLRVR